MKKNLKVRNKSYWLYAEKLNFAFVAKAVAVCFIFKIPVGKPQKQCPPFSRKNLYSLFYLWFVTQKNSLEVWNDFLTFLPILDSLSLWIQLWGNFPLSKNSVYITASKVPVFGDFLVLIFLHSERIRRDTEYLSVFRPNAGKYGPEKLRIPTIFT